MVDFRKWLPVLAVLALFGLTMTASAQPLTCVANAAAPTNVRAEGLAELVGDVVINCTGSTAGFQSNIQVFLNTNITSKIVSGSNITEATLLINDQVASAFLGQRVSDNSLAWLNVPIPSTAAAPAGSGFSLRITNVRANANQAGVSSTLVPNQIVMFLSTSGTQALPINNPQQVVAFVQKGISDFRTRLCDDSDNAGSATTFRQCSSSNKDLATDQTKTNGSISYNIRFDEGFANAFRQRITVGTPTAPGQNVPNTVYSGSESGLTITVTPATSPVGVATNGTRLIARFANVPNGVFLFVTTTDTAHVSATGTSAAFAAKVPTTLPGSFNGTSISTTAAGGRTMEAVLISTTDPTGSSGDAGFPIPRTGAATCTNTSDSTIKTSYDIAPVPVINGTGAATWEIRNSDPFAIEKVSFGVVVSFAASASTNSPAIGKGTVSGNFAPISTVGTASSVALIPRFADVAISQTAVNTVACISRLLFPFVTNQAGFDTGIVISNTTSDPWDNPQQSGTCTISYFGATTGGGAAPAAQTSGVVNTGAQLVFTLGMGGNLGMTATAGFQGYIAAECRFQLAHGFAFLTNGTTAQGYLALVLPTTARTDNLSAGAESRGL